MKRKLLFEKIIKKNDIKYYFAFKIFCSKSRSLQVIVSLFFKYVTMWCGARDSVLKNQITSSESVSFDSQPCRPLRGGTRSRRKKGISMAHAHVKCTFVQRMTVRIESTRSGAERTKWGRHWKQLGNYQGHFEW